MRLASRLILTWLIAAIVGMPLAAYSAVITQWNFNVGAVGGPNPNVFNNPSTGTGTLSTINVLGIAPLNVTLTLTGAPLSPAASTQDTGSLGDPLGIGDRAVLVGNGPDPGTPSTYKGVQFFTSTAGKSKIAISLDMIVPVNGSRFYQLQATSDGGANWSNVSGGLGIDPSILGANVSSATVSNTGLISVASTVTNTIINSNVPAAFSSSFGYEFAAGSIYENNPLFGFRVMVAHDPNGTDYASAGGVGFPYARTGAGLSTGYRIDYVTISSIPEPSSLSLCGLMFGCGLLTRRRDA